MAHTFKLRLGDGTELAVDHVGLRTWVMDEKATVKTKNGWRSLRDVLAVLDRPPKPDDGVAVIPFKRLDGEPQRPTNRPPPSTADLPSLRLADSGPEETGDDVYDGDDGDDIYDDGPGVLGTAFLWTKRVVLLAGLGVGGFFAATTWETWLPKAGGFGVAVLGEIQKHTGGAKAAAVTVGDTSEESRAAVQAASAELPHLSAEAIQLVMSSSLTGVLDAPEVFRRANDAADRGVSALTADEAQELRGLKAALLERLSRVERERVKEYDQARGHRATLPFEDRAALGSWGHATRALPQRSQDRLRALLGKTIASGLRTAPAASPAAVATR